MGNYLTFDGISTADYGVEISGEGVFNAPARVYEMIEIPGRNGALAIDQGRFENIVVTYPAYNYETNMTDFAESLRDLRNALASRSGYCRLTDTFHPDEYRLGIFKSGLDVDVVKYNTASEFDITFDCKPQRWLTSGEELLVFTEATTLTNPTLFASAPLIRVSGSDGTVTINDITINVAQLPAAYSGQELYIDCEIGEAYCYDLITGELVNLNSYVSLSEYPRLDPGANNISFTEYITRVSFVPRWWRV